MGSPDSVEYIRMVHHLIEECIVFKMNKEECMEALTKHANVNPIIASTVWKELEKENKEFFEDYNKEIEERASSAAETDESETSQITDDASIN
ncbi:hypothetical protein ABFS83_12G135300 [Erythranthe nasuta]